MQSSNKLLINFYRNSHRRCSLKKVALRNLLKFTGKHLAQVFSSEICDISENTCFTEHLWMTASASDVSWMTSKILNLNVKKKKKKEKVLFMVHLHGTFLSAEVTLRSRFCQACVIPLL